jgi:hypothetical protein
VVEKKNVEKVKPQPLFEAIFKNKNKKKEEKQVQPTYVAPPRRRTNLAEVV